MIKRIPTRRPNIAVRAVDYVARHRWLPFVVLLLALLAVNYVERH